MEKLYDDTLLHLSKFLSDGDVCRMIRTSKQNKQKWEHKNICDHLTSRHFNKKNHTSSILSAVSALFRIKKISGKWGEQPLLWRMFVQVVQVH